MAIFCGPNASSRPRLMKSAAIPAALVDRSASHRTVRRRSCSGVPGTGWPSTPKIPAMITSSVMACMRVVSSTVSPTDHVSTSCSAASAIISA
jgi:hypothetical protein